MKKSIINHLGGFRSNREALVCLLIGCMIFVISLIISNLYTKSDQAGYHVVYEAMSGLSLGDDWDDIQAIYLCRISGQEIFHFLFILIGGMLEIDKNLFMSVFNGILAAYSVRLFLCWGANLWLAAAIVLSNYYFYVLYFAAERLKFAFLFLVLSLLYVRKPLWFLIYTFASIWSHFSVLFIYCGIWLANIPDKVASRCRGMDVWLGLGLPAALVILGVVWKSEYLFWKLNSYIAASGPFSILKLVPVGCLVVFACAYAKRPIITLLHFLPILVGTAIWDGSRLNMLAFFVFLYFVLQVKGGLNMAVLLSMLYFTYKTVVFVSNIASYGHGFP